MATALRWRSFLFIASLPIIAVVVACAPGSDRRTAPKVFLYGDSILYEAKPALQRASREENLTGISVRATPGFAPCDWTDRIRHDLEATPRAVAVVETVGNSWTSCMFDRGRRVEPGSPAFYRRYTRDLERIADLAARNDAKLVFLTPFPVASPTFNSVLERIAAIERRTAASRAGRISVSNALTGAVARSGTYAQRLPCLPSETPAMGCSGGTIPVREPTGLHLCPTGYASVNDVFRGCPVYSSGAERFAKALTRLVERALNDRSPASGST
ncbi:MAG: hypothetical protein ACKO2C_00265 [Actinomycetes bacterium]